MLNKPKKNYSFYNEYIVKELLKKYGFGKDYTLKAIWGDRKRVIPLKIKNEYDRLEKASRSAINKEIKKIVAEEIAPLNLNL